jgi:hypothetical protein
MQKMQVFLPKLKFFGWYGSKYLYENVFRTPEIIYPSITTHQPPGTAQLDAGHGQLDANEFESPIAQ